MFLRMRVFKGARSRPGHAQWVPLSQVSSRTHFHMVRHLDLEKREINLLFVSLVFFFQTVM